MNKQAEDLPVNWGAVFYKMQETGKSLSEIGKEYGMNKNQVAGVIYRWRVKNNKPPLNNFPGKN